MLPRMRLFLNRICLLALLLLPALAGKAQLPTHRTIVTISHPYLDIATLAKIIAAQTGMQYSLNMQNDALQTMVSLKAGTWQLDDVMAQVETQAHLRLKVVGNHILFLNKVAAKVEAIKAPLAANDVKVGKVTHKAANAATDKPVRKPTARKALHNTSPVTNTPAKVDTTDTQLVSNEVTDTATAISRPGNLSLLNGQDSLMWATKTPDKTANKTGQIPNPQQDSLLAAKQSASKAVAAKQNASAADKQDKSSAKNSSPKEKDPLFLLKAGVGVDEAFYANGTINLGTKYLYGIATLGSDFKVIRFRYGLGIPVKITQRQRVYATFTTGNTKYTVDSLQIDLPGNFPVKETLNRYGIGWSYALSNHLLLQAVIQYEQLARKVDLSTNPSVDLTRIRDFDYKYVHIPYTPKSNGTIQDGSKTWLGLQVTLLYSIF
jgi:hypothetical protein